MKHSAKTCQYLRELHLSRWKEKDIKRLEDWKFGNEVKPRVAKRLLIFESGEKCSRCSWGERNPFSDTIPIELEHKDGNCYNNSYKNVCLLCPNCHALTSTFRVLNARKGKGRKFYKVVSQWAKEQHIKGIWSSVSP